MPCVLKEKSAFKTIREGGGGRARASIFQQSNNACLIFFLTEVALQMYENKDFLIEINQHCFYSFFIIAADHLMASGGEISNVLLFFLFSSIKQLGRQCWNKNDLIRFTNINFKMNKIEKKKVDDCI